MFWICSLVEEKVLSYNYVSDVIYIVCREPVKNKIVYKKIFNSANNKWFKASFYMFLSNITVP